jgi:hypothetical protein
MNELDFLESFRKELKIFKSNIQDASMTILRDEVSKFPIFIAYKDFFPVGEKILVGSELSTEWSVNASTAEQLIQEGIIQLEKARIFIASYKPPETHCCILVVPEKRDDAQFVYVPY